MLTQSKPPNIISEYSDERPSVKCNVSSLISDDYKRFIHMVMNRVIFNTMELYKRITGVGQARPLFIRVLEKIYFFNQLIGHQNTYSTPLSLLK
ncbi:hypothetical protein RIF29_01932 [Crotalaria pallida]|uniref:Uncharacterized protein n=1 Tax=Crotalaria pallida TaxID=3830 RepID=A0AAN9IY06_CROPI